MGYLNLSGLSRFYTGLKGKFLLQSNVANVLTTTAAGKALDARQGKALKDLIDGGNPTYTHTKNGTVHNFAGAGKLGYAILTADYASGDTFTVNGTPVTVYGDMSMLADDAGVVLTVSGGVLYFYAAASPFTIPDGDTVATLNDAGIWLSCAGVNPATVGNPTLSTLLSSQSYCDTLMNSANAVNYMLRSPTILTGVYGSSTAIGELDGSNPFVSQYMTSNTSPAGYAAATALGACYTPISETDTFFVSTANTKWLQLTLPVAVWPYRIASQTRGTQDASPYAITVTYAGSNDGATWTTIGSRRTPNGGDNGAAVETLVTATMPYRYYRITPSNQAGGSQWWICKVRVTGKTREV